MGAKWFSKPDSGEKRPAGSPPSVDCLNVAGAVNEFTLALYSRLAQGEGNLFVSAGSIHAALTMIWAGARGRTAEQMAAVLGMSAKYWTVGGAAVAYHELLQRIGAGMKAGCRLDIANGLWGQTGYPWSDDFLQLTRDSFGAELRTADFKTACADARETINRWVDERTTGTIPELLDPGDLNELTRMVLVNAIHFKAAWARCFCRGDTRPENFKVLGREPRTVPMMAQKAKFGYHETEDLRILRMAYLGGALGMVVLLPKEDVGLERLERDLSGAMQAANKWNLAKEEVTVVLPRFTVTSAFRLADVLGAMGMSDVFDEGSADLTGAYDRRLVENPVCLSNVIHKTCVEVNEKGTVATAATGAPPWELDTPSRVFCADHPFIFFIRHEATGAILFMGRVVDPHSEEP